jgi:hypothetical protein
VFQRKIFSIGLCLLACGGGTAAGPAAESAPKGESTESDAPAAAASESGGTIEDQRADFVGACLKKSQKKEYCDCSFEQFKEVFKDADLSKPLAEDDPRLAQLQTKIAGQCAATLSEAEVRASFMDGCAKGDERKSAYCSCAWSSLRKKLAYTEFVGAGDDDSRWLEPRKKMVVECKGKYPTEIAKFDFMQACTKGESAAETACTCKWNKLKKQFSTEELVAGTADVASTKGLADCNK